MKWKSEDSLKTLIMKHLSKTLTSQWQKLSSLIEKSTLKEHFFAFISLLKRRRETLTNWTALSHVFTSDSMMINEDWSFVTDADESSTVVTVMTCIDKTVLWEALNEMIAWSRSLSLQWTFCSWLTSESDTVVDDEEWSLNDWHSEFCDCKLMKSRTLSLLTLSLYVFCFECWFRSSDVLSKKLWKKSRLMTKNIK